MKVFQKKIKYKAGDIFSIVAYGDLHWSARYCEEKLYTEMLQQYQGNPNAYFFDLGDTTNSIHVRDQRFDFRELASRFEGRQDLIDAQIDDYCEAHAKHGDPLQELGKISGNHPESVVRYDGTNPTRRICEKLDITYLGYSCYYWLEFEHEGGGCSRKYLFFLHHGWGGGTRSEGGNLNKYMKILSRYDYDIGLFGHSLRGNRYIPLLNRETKEIHVKPIGEFVDAILKDDDIDTLSIDNKKWATCVLRDRNSKWASITQVHRHFYNGDLIDVRSRFGGSVITPDHSIYVFRDNNKKLIKGKDIRETDALIHCNRLIPPFGLGSHISEDLAWLMGLVLAEGWVDKWQVGIANKDRELLEKAIKIVKKYYPGKPCKIHERPDGTKQFIIGSVIASKFFSQIGKGAHNKRIPNFIFFAPSNIKKAFLDGYYDGDGSKENKRWRIKTASKGLMNDLHLLYRFYHGNGILKSRIDRGKYYELDRPSSDRHITSKNGYWFASPIIKLKKERVHEYVYDIGVAGAHHFFDCDGMTLVHNSHEGWSKTTARIGAESKGEERKLIHKKQITANVPSFLKTLSDNEDPTYSEAKGYFPIGLGWIEIRIDPRHGKMWVIEN